MATYERQDTKHISVFYQKRKRFGVLHLFLRVSFYLISSRHMPWIRHKKLKSQNAITHQTPHQKFLLIIYSITASIGLNPNVVAAIKSPNLFTPKRHKLSCSEQRLTKQMKTVECVYGSTLSSYSPRFGIVCCLCSKVYRWNDIK